jgi:hypothetical protein
LIHQDKTDIRVIVYNLKFQLMSKKTFNLITGIVGALQTIGVAIVTYTETGNATAINSAVVVIGTAVIEACSQFVKPE